MAGAVLAGNLTGVGTMSATKEALYDLCEAHGLDPSHPRSWAVCQWILDRESLAYDAPGLELPEVLIAYVNGEPLVIPVNPCDLLTV